MATELESLQISINAKAKSANQAIDSLVGRLDILSKSLGKINRGSSNISGLANGVDKLGRAMQTMNSVSTADFTRLATNLEKMGKINVASLNSAASSMSHLSRALSTLSGVSANSTQIVDVANSIGKLGGVSVQRAITNMPQLASAMNNLMTTLSRSPQVSRNLIDMTNALANLSSQGQRISTATNSMVNGLGNTDKAVRRTKKSTLSLAATFGKFYASYFLVIRGMKSLWKSIESTADYFEAYNYFNVAMTKIGSDWSSQFADYGYDNAESYAESFNKRLTEKLSQLSGVKINAESGTLEATATKNLGLNIQEVTQYASQLASVTNSVGQTGEVSLATASAFTKLGADMSSLFNMDYSQVMNNLQSGLIGQSRALYRYGIDITNATLQTLAYELGVEKAVSEMTQAEKMQLRLIAILDQSRVSWGDQANTINSTSNQIRLLKNNLSETGMILGQLFIPILDNLLPALNGLSIAFKRLLTDIAGFMGISIDLDSFGQGYSGIEDDINAEADAYDNATESAKKYRNQILSFDEVTKLQDTDSDSSGSGASGSVNLENEIIKATEEYEKAWQEAYDKMENRAEQFADAIYKTFKQIGKKIEPIANGIGNLYGGIFHVGENFGSGLIDFLIDFADTALGFTNTTIADVLYSIGDGLKSIDADTLHDIGYNFGLLTTELLKFGAVISSGLLGGLVIVVSKNDELKQSLSESATNLRDSFIPLIQLISNEILPDLQNGFSEVLSIIQPVADFIETVLTSAWNDFLIPAMNYFAETVIPNVTETLSNLWNNIFVPLAEFISSVLEPAFKIISDVLTMLWENVVVPLADAVGINLQSGFEGIFAVVNDKVIPVFSSIIEKLTYLWKKVINPIINLLWDNLKPVFETVFDFIGKRIENLSTILSGAIGFITGVFSGDWEKAWNGILETFSGVWSSIKNVVTTTWDFITGVFSAGGTIFVGIVDGVADVFKSIVNGLIDGINKVIATPFNKINGLLNDIRDIEILGAEPFSGLWDEDPLPVPKIPKFATGGFPEDGLFFANHNELVGQFSNGQTAVANNEQIVQGIAQGIAPAVYNAVLSAMRDSTTNGNGDTVVMIDGKEVFRAVKKQADNYTISTGQTAFLM